MHECEDCGQMCACDIDDMEFEQPSDCKHLLRPQWFCGQEPYCGLCDAYGHTPTDRGPEDTRVWPPGVSEAEQEG